MAGQSRSPERLRIASVGRHFDDSGSLWAHYARNCERLAADEDVVAVCSGASRRPTSARIAFETVDSIVPEHGRIRRAVSRGEFAVRATRAVRRLRDRVDVVHVDGVSALEADLLTVHSVRSADAARYWTEINPAGPARRLVGTLGRPLTLVERAIERRLLRDRPLCLAVTQVVKSDLERTYGVAPELIEVVPYPVELRAFAFSDAARATRRTALRVADDRLVALFVGDDFERKGLRRAISALALSSDGDIELWVIGGADPRSFAAEARERGVGERVRFLGRRPPGELPSWYSAADVVLLPSEFDVWGIPVIEALAAGRVVVVSAFTGASEVIRHGESGFVLDRVGEPEQIAAVLDGEVRNTERRRAIGESARLVAAPFDADVVYRRFREAHHRARALRLAPSHGRPRT